MSAAGQGHTAVVTELLKDSRLDVNLQKQVIRTFAPDGLAF